MDRMTDGRAWEPGWNGRQEGAPEGPATRVPMGNKSGQAAHATACSHLPRVGRTEPRQPLTAPPPTPGTDCDLTNKALSNSPKFCRPPPVLWAWHRNPQTWLEI